MNDDLNTAVALSVLFDMVRMTNPLLETPGTTKQTLATISEKFNTLGGGVLGIVLENYPETGGGDEELIGRLVEGYIEQRNIARKNKEYKIADAIRDKLNNIGIVLEDAPEGTTWKRK